MNLLHIDSSALGAHPVSRELGAAIVGAWQRTHSGTKVVHRDPAARPPPHWTPLADVGDPVVRRSSRRILDADVVVIGAPMYNFTIPSTLKAWIDRIAVAGKTFRYGASGAEGLVGDKRAIIASARGGSCSAGTPGAAADFQEACLRQVFGFLGVTEIEFVRRRREHQPGPQGAGDRFGARSNRREPARRGVTSVHVPEPGNTIPTQPQRRA